MSIRDVVIKCLNNVGIVIDSEADDVNINDYSVDSITFISFIVEIENELNIEIPDGYLYADILKSLNGFVGFVEKLIEMNQERRIEDEEGTKKAR